MRELFDIAILAYRNKRFNDAIEYLISVLDIAPNNWMARLYLGMSYQRAGRVSDADRLFRRMVQVCPDLKLKQQAETALTLVEAEMRCLFNPVKQIPTTYEIDEDGNYDTTSLDALLYGSAITASAKSQEHEERVLQAV